MPRRVAIILSILLTAMPISGSETIEFNRDVRPILSNKCFACHGPDEGSRESGLRLDTEEGAGAELESGDGQAVVGHDLASSQLWQRVISDDPDLRMPVGGEPLPPQQLKTLRSWIEQGAHWQPHWSYVPPRLPEVPMVSHSRWSRNAIDRFIGSRLNAMSLSPSPKADRVTRIRRLSLDLLGLPPSTDEVRRFVNDDQPDAYESLVDRLIASPHFGERLAVYWLDFVRYADTVGYHGDQEHSISPYRDYVINAFNANLPFDQFTIEQLAGDLLRDATKWQKVASGYNRLLQTTHEGGAQDSEYLAKYAADRVRTTASVWMGATMGCCECHDHKFDPYTIDDFYRFAAFFADLREYGAYPAPNSNPTKRVPEMLVLEWRDEMELEEVAADLLLVKQEFAADEKNLALEEKVKALQSRIQAIQSRGRWTMVSETTTPRDVRVLDRGDWMDTTSPLASPAIPAFMGKLDTFGRPSRLDLARWLVSRDQPQTARVMVNRLWQIFTGVGISKVTDDLGSQGEWPVNPELLDWLAIELMDSDWDLKHVVRLIVTSATYQQASMETDEHRSLDPENRWLARQSRFRLDAEVIRDSAMAVSGLLVEDVGGRSIKPYQPTGYYAHLNFPERTYRSDTGAPQYRRGVYIHWQRQFLHPMLKAFDAPSREECTAQRPRSNTPLAALTLMNDPSFVEAARALAQRMLGHVGSDDRKRLEWGFREVFSRSLREQEATVLLALVHRQREIYQHDKEAAQALVSIGLSEVPQDADVAELAAWTAVTRALLNTHEAITRN